MPNPFTASENRTLPLARANTRLPVPVEKVVSWIKSLGAGMANRSLRDVASGRVAQPLADAGVMGLRLAALGRGPHPAPVPDWC